jgi:ABC-type nitrate/sulfonate/bicarbonate transport system substrate-binding protein
MSATQSPGKENSVDVWYTVCPVPSAIAIAAGRGVLQKAFDGTSVNLQTVRTHADRKVREAHYDQTQSNLFREGGNVPPLWAKSLGRNLRLLGLTDLGRSSLVVALPESGIRTAADLKGRRLGIIKRPNDQIDHARAHTLRTYLTALAAGSVTRDDVTFVDILVEKAQVEAKPDEGVLSSSAFSVGKLRSVDGQFVKALFQGHVDAIVISGGRTGLLALLGGHVVFDTADAADPRDRSIPVLFTVRGELLESHPDIVTAYVAENIRSARWARANPAEAARYIARDTGVTEEDVALGYGPSLAARLEPSLAPELVTAVEHQKNFLLREGFLAGDFSITDFIAPGPLAAARKLVDIETAQRAA